MTETRCELPRPDSCGHHRACQWKGEEACHSHRAHGVLKDMNVEVGAEDARQIEVFAQDLPCFGGRDVALC